LPEFIAPAGLVGDVVGGCRRKGPGQVVACARLGHSRRVDVHAVRGRLAPVGFSGRSARHQKRDNHHPGNGDCDGGCSLQDT